MSEPLKVLRVGDLARIFGITRDGVLKRYRKGHLPKPLRMGGRGYEWSAKAIERAMESEQQPKGSDKR